MQKIVLIALCLFCAVFHHAYAGEAFWINHGATIISEKNSWLVIDGPHALQISMDNEASFGFYHLKIAGGALYLDSETAISVYGILLNELGPESLMLFSSPSSTASLIHHSTGVAATLQRFIAGVDDWYASPATDWHMISSPVIDQDISAFIPDSEEGDYDFYGWCEGSLMWVNYKNAAAFSEYNNGLLFNEGQGYLVAYEQDHLFSYTGEMHVGDINCNTLTHSGHYTYAGWHLLGNPYASALDWNDEHWQRLEVYDEIHIWDSQRGNYIFNNNGIGDFSGIVPPHQGIFIKARHQFEKGASLNIPEAARRHAVYSDNYENKSLPANTLRLEVHATGNTYHDVLFVLIREEASLEFNHQYDTHKLDGTGRAPEIYSKKGSRNLSMLGMPAATTLQEIPVWFRKGSYDHFVFKAYGTDHVEGLQTIMLKDLHTGILRDLRQYPEFEFIAHEPSEEARFVLFYDDSDLNTEEYPSPEDDIVLYSCSRNIHIVLPEQHVPALLKVAATDGRIWMMQQLTESGVHQFKIPAVSGLLIAQVVSEHTTETIKIIHQ